MKGIIRQVGQDADATQENIEKTLAGSQLLLAGPRPARPGARRRCRGAATGTSHFHPLAVASAIKFGLRPRIDDFDDFTQVITFGMAGDGKEVAEIHCFITEKFVVTLHEGRCPALLAVVLQRVRDHRDTQIPPQVGLLYLILDSLIDSFFPVLSELDDDIDDLESAILKNPTEEQLGTLFDMKRRVLAIRKVVAPQRDMIESLNGGMVSIPGLTDTDSVLLPQRLRAHHPHHRHGGLLPGPDQRGDGHPPVHGVQPAQRDHEAAGHRGHLLPAAGFPHRVLRPELRLA